MDPNEIIKAAPEIGKGLTAIGAAIPFTAIIKKMLGPAANELAERLHDSVRLYRYGRQLDCLKKAEQMAVQAGFTPKAVPIKLLFPLLEGVSLEEEEGLHTMWAALLANASGPSCGIVRPSFISTLKQMAPDEARLLEYLYDDVVSDDKEKYFGGYGFSDLERHYASLNLGSKHSLNPCVQCLINAGFLRTREVGYWKTEFGYHFMLSCLPPKPKF